MYTLNIIQSVPNLLPLPLSFLTILTSTLCEVTCNLVYQEISINDWIVLFSFGTILCAMTTLLKTTSSCEYFDVRIEVRLKEERNAREKSERETSWQRRVILRDPWNGRSAKGYRVERYNPITDSWIPDGLPGAMCSYTNHLSISPTSRLCWRRRNRVWGLRWSKLHPLLSFQREVRHF